MESKYKAIAALALAVVLALGWSSVQVVERRKQATLDRVVGAAFLAQAAARTITPLSLPSLPADVQTRPAASLPTPPADVEATTAAFRDEVGRPPPTPAPAPAPALAAKATRASSGTTAVTAPPRAVVTTTRQTAVRKAAATKKSAPLASATATARRMDVCAGAAPARPGCAKSPPSRRTR